MNKGQLHMEGCGSRLVALKVVSVRIVDWPEAPLKGDAADFDGDNDALHELLEASMPFRLLPAIDLGQLLDDLRGFVRRYVVLADPQAVAVALWAAHTHTLEAFDTTPYLEVNSAEKKCGKTRLLEALSLVVARPWLTGRVSPAVLVRKCDREMPALLLDESDAAFRGDKDYGEALRGILNSGYRRGGVASLCVKSGGDFELRDFSTFGAKAIAGIGRLPDTTSDRAIQIALKRRVPTETIERFRWRDAEPGATMVRERLESWALTALAVLRTARPDLPVELDDRAADVWEPLLAIAELAGDEWPHLAREAALVLSCGAGRDDESIGVKLLTDIRRGYLDKTADRLFTSDVLDYLNAVEESPWGQWHGKLLTAHALAKLLHRFNIKPKQIRIGERTNKGYEYAQFSDAVTRYLPEVTETTETTETDTGSKPR